MVAVACGCVFATMPEGRGADSPPPASEIDLSTDATVDEQLFMVRRLENLYAQWPSDFSDRAAATSRTVRLRDELIRAHAYLQDKECDKRLLAMYADSIAMAERYGEFLADIGAIDADFKRQRDGASDIVDGFGEGARAGIGLAMASVEPVTASLVIGGMAIKKGIQSYEESKRLTAANAAAIDRRLDKYLVERSRLLGHIEVQAEVLAEKHGWETTEVGFDEDEEESTRFAAAIEAADFDFLFSHALGLAKARPRDPFVHGLLGSLLEKAAAAVGTSDADVAMGMRRNATEAFVTAARFVPKGRFHDGLRSTFLLAAARNVNAMLYSDPEADDYDGIAIVDAALRAEPRDPSGRMRREKAFLLARTGHGDDAVSLFDSCAAMLGDSPATLYDRACILSLAGRTAESLRHIDAAWQRGVRDVRMLRDDRDLQRLREAKAEWFAGKKPRLAVDFQYGWAWNTVVVRNESGFPVTAGQTRIQLTGTDGRVRTEVYWIGDMAENETRQVAGVFDGPESWENKSRRKLLSVCEESHGEPATDRRTAVGEWRGTETLMNIDGSDVRESAAARIRVAMAEDGLRVQFQGIGRGNTWEGCDYQGGVVNCRADRGLFWMRVANGTAYGLYTAPGDEQGFCHSFAVSRQDMPDMPRGAEP